MLPILSILKTKITLVTWQILAGIILILGIFLYFHFKQPESTNKPIQGPQLQDIIITKDKKGDPIGVIKENTYSESQVKHLSDSLRKVYGVAKVISQIKIVTKIDTQLKDKVFYLDTLDKSLFTSYSDKDLYIEFTGNYSTKDGVFHFKLLPDTTSFTEVEKKHLFKANEREIILQHTNNYFKTIQGSSYNTSIPKTIICFGPSIGVSYLNNKITPIYGVTATINIFSIKSK